jgi:hypothetical protein
MAGLHSAQGEPVHTPFTSGDITLTEMQDGTLRILRNGIPIEGHCWKPTEIHIAQRKFEELVMRLAMEPEYEQELNQQQHAGRRPRGNNTGWRFNHEIFH